MGNVFFPLNESKFDKVRRKKLLGLQSYLAMFEKDIRMIQKIYS